MNCYQNLVDPGPGDRVADGRNPADKREYADSESLQIGAAKTRIFNASRPILAGIWRIHSVLKIVRPGKNQEQIQNNEPCYLLG